jgi:hypothetical protein
MTACALLTSGSLSPATAQVESPWQVWSEVSPVAVLLFSNYTGTNRAVEAVMPRVYWELDLRGADYRSHSEIRPVLRRHRIRALGGITEKDAQAIRSETGAGLLLLGTIDIFQPDDILEVGVSARVIAIDDMEVLAAQSVAATNEDFAGLYGFGRIESPEELAARVVEQLFDELEHSLAPPIEPYPRPARVAIVPFDDFTDRAHAGDVVSGILASELANRGYRVVEPGAVRGLAFEKQRVLRGGIDHPMLAILVSELDADFVVTGEVATFRAARGSADFAAPTIEFGARLVDAQERQLVLSYDRVRDGRDGEIILGMGQTYSLGRLTRASIAKFVQEIERRAPHDFARDSYEGRTP